MGQVILIIDDEETVGHFLGQSLQGEGYEVLRAGTGADGLRILNEGEVDLVLLDRRLPDLNGSEVLREIRRAGADLPVIMLTGYATIDSAVEAIKTGAYDYVEKSPDLTPLKLSIARALESHALRQEIRRLRTQQAREHRWIVGRSRPLQQVAEMVEKIAATKAAVLVQGESGTGKEVIAQAIHRRSERAERSFLAINCAAIPENLLESELFGHEAGAFTDAKRQKKGLFELADGGTLFLDEIGNMPLSMQAKLLRVLESETFRRVGGIKDLQVDLRVIAATNRDLKAAIREGSLRDDLYYRLSVVVIEIPPLRQRLEDMDEFVAAFVVEFSGAMGKSVSGVSPEALALLRGYHWPGNVRELRNVMERGVILCDGEEITPGHLPAEIVERGRARLPVNTDLEQVNLGAGGLDLKATVARFERRMIEEALRRANGNQSEAARLLGISRDVLRYSLQKYGLNSTSGSESREHIVEKPG